MVTNENDRGKTQGTRVGIPGDRGSDPTRDSGAAAGSPVHGRRDRRKFPHQRDATARICELNAKPLRTVSDWLQDYEAFWRESLGSLKRYVEEDR